MNKLWYYRWKYNLPREPEPLVDRGERIQRWNRRMDLTAVAMAFVIACLAVAIYHFTSY